MKIIEVGDARQNLDKILEAIKTEPVFVSKNEECVAVVISYERYDVLMDAMEYLEDSKDLDPEAYVPQAEIPWGVAVEASMLREEVQFDWFKH